MGLRWHDEYNHAYSWWSFWSQNLMTKGKPWTTEEEKQLREPVNAGASPKDIAEKMGKTRIAVRSKITHLGLKEDATRRRNALASSSNTLALELPKDLPSVEEALKMFAGALQMSAQSGLDKVEV
jgi:hypothetical protein